MNQQIKLGSLPAAGIEGFSFSPPSFWIPYQGLLWLLLGPVFVVGGSLVVALMFAHRWGLLHELFIQHLALILAVVAAYAVAMMIVEKTSRFPGWSSITVVLPAVTGVFLVLVCALLITRFYYSRSFVISAYCLSLLWLTVGMYLRRRYMIPHLTLVPEGAATQLAAIHSVRWQVLMSPSLADIRAGGVVVDLHAKLPDAWLHFIAECALHRIPVYHARSVYESVTGRASLAYMSDGFMSNLESHGAYLLCKRVFDVVTVLVLVPVIAPLMGIIALSIKLDSHGPVFFVQERVGRGGQIFRMLKFRSMHVQSNRDSPKFACHSDPRITRVGVLLRRLRLDELPQVCNVLLGQMSIVGPRPEQVGFVKFFETQIPYYTYRHVVRPGITGWAQVTHGYTSDVASTTEKVERDIYYIGRMSFWLDLVILVRTMCILITGFGSR